VSKSQIEFRLWLATASSSTIDAKPGSLNLFWINQLSLIARKPFVGSLLIPKDRNRAIKFAKYVKGSLFVGALMNPALNDEKRFPLIKMISESLVNELANTINLVASSSELDKSLSSVTAQSKPIECAKERPNLIAFPYPA